MEPETFAQGAMALVIGLLAWLGNKMWDKQKELEAAQALCASRLELTDCMREAKTDRRDMHKQNTDALAAITETVSGVREDVAYLRGRHERKNDEG